MYRGRITFKCTECGNTFTAPDIELMTTIFSQPQRCPKCNSIRTRPISIFGKLANKQYKPIWEMIEKSEKMNNSNNNKSL